MFAGERFLVVGSGVSGRAALDFLEREGAETICCNSDEPMPAGVEAKVEKVVVSPGVSLETAMVKRFRERGIPVFGELELGFRVEKGRVIAITGTNGKTTTTTLVGEMMKACFGQDKTFVVGNIGNPYTSQAHKTDRNTVTVAEVSSFQLESIETFRPCVSVILNITPDHLDRHHSMEAYVQAKRRVMENQREEDFCVLNYDNVYTRAMIEGCPARVRCFSVKEELWNGYFLQGQWIVKSVDGSAEKLLRTEEIPLEGLCNVENVMAAIAAADAMQVPWETVREVIRAFRAVEHRIEYVDTVAGVDYYNDSKATNPDAAIQGILAMKKPTVLIGGGSDKNNEYDEWIQSFGGKVRWLVLMGQTREKIAACAMRHGFRNIRLAQTAQEAFTLAAGLAREGEAVLLSPACASFGLFENYEERGRSFKEFVREQVPLLKRESYGGTEKPGA